MYLSLRAASLLAIVGVARAQTAGFDPISKPAKDEVVAAGSTYTIAWTAQAQDTGKVSITLLQGQSSGTLQLGDIVATSIDNALNSFAWAVPSTLGSQPVYGLKIALDNDTSIFQYSNPFSIKAAAAAGASTSSSSVAASTPTTSAPGIIITPPLVSPSSSASSSASATASALSTQSTVTSVASSSLGMSSTGSVTSGSMTTSTTTGASGSVTTTGTIATTAGTSSASATATGAAGRVRVGGGVVAAGLAVAAFIV